MNRAVLAVFLVLAFPLSAQPTDISAIELWCAEFQDGLCWLRDAQLRAQVVWTFSQVPGDAELLLEVEAIAIDPCGTRIGRDVPIRLYYSQSNVVPWQILDLLLQNVTPEIGPVGYTVRGQARILWHAPTAQGEFVLMAKRVIICSPYLSFSPKSAVLRLVEAPALPPPPPEAPPEEVCTVESRLDCFCGQDPPCISPDLPDWEIERNALPETLSPTDALIIEPGHWQGSLDPKDNQDWYRIKVPQGKALVIWLGTSQTLRFDLYVLHDPCGWEMASLINCADALYCVVPCIDEHCSWFIRIIRRSGEGDYLLSLYIVEARP